MTEHYVTFVVWFKQCTKCGKLKPGTPEYFYRHKKAARFGDGLYPSCKECKDAYRKTPKGREVTLKKTERWRNSTEAGRRYRSGKALRKRKRYPNKHAARKAVNMATRQGKMPSASECKCAKCGKQARDYHHWSYKPEHWLDVIPVCRQCHNKIHGTIPALPAQD